MMNKGPMPKLRNERLTLDHLRERARRIVLAGYRKSKWIDFCETLILKGYDVMMYESKSSESKYVFINQPGLLHHPAFKVRFSSHKPNKEKEKIQDSDFYVGKLSSGRWNTTDDALKAVYEHFNDKENV